MPLVRYATSQIISVVEINKSNLIFVRRVEGNLENLWILGSENRNVGKGQLTEPQQSRLRGVSITFSVRDKTRKAEMLVKANSPNLNRADSEASP